MHNKIVQILLGFFLSFTLSFNLGLRQIVHSHAGHSDTIHSCSKEDSKNAYAKIFFDKEHHHCDYLTDVLPAFLNSTFYFNFAQIEAKQFAAFVIAPYSIYPQDGVYQFQLRGPPPLA